MYSEYPILPNNRVNRLPILLFIELGEIKVRNDMEMRHNERKAYPAKKDANANVAYTAACAFADIFPFTCPLRPRPLSVLNNPGQRKHVNAEGIKAHQHAAFCIVPRRT